MVKCKWPVKKAIADLPISMKGMNFKCPSGNLLHWVCWGHWRTMISNKTSQTVTACTSHYREFAVYRCKHSKLRRRKFKPLQVLRKVLPDIKLKLKYKHSCIPNISTCKLFQRTHPIKITLSLLSHVLLLHTPT